MSFSSWPQPGEQTSYTLTAARAGFWRRLAADVIDGLMLFILLGIFDAAAKNVGDAIAILLGLAYFTLLEGGPRGQTLGKSAMSIRVASIQTGQSIGYQHALIRELGRIPSAIPLYLGYLWMLWDPQKQTWHDKLVRAVVVPIAP